MKKKLGSKWLGIDSDKVEKAIAEFESSVDFELVPIIALKSSYVEHIGWMISLLLLLTFTALIDFFFQNSWSSKTIYYVAAPFVAVLLGHIIDKSDIVDRFFISKQERSRQVFEKAQRIFFLKNLHELKGQNSIILFISIMERRIVVFPDPRLNFPNLGEVQQKVLKILQTSFANNDYEGGLIEAIGYLRTNLSLHFPPSATKKENALSNKLIWWAD